MKNENDLGSNLTDPLSTFANDYHWRSTKAKQQLRDRFGRWISLGANVSFRDQTGTERTGVVTSVLDGKAYVDQKNLDGTITKQILDPGVMRVIASKATLPPDGSKIYDAGNNFSKAMQTDEYKKAMHEFGQAVINRADGFSLAAANVAQGGPDTAKDGTEKLRGEKTGANPVVYQLYAPGGRSLGKYSDAATGDFDAMVSDYKGAPSSPGASPAGGDAPAAAGGVVASGEEKPYRVPEAVKGEIRTTLSSFSTEMPEADLAVATRLANDSTVSLSDVQWVHGFFTENDLSERLRGGYKGRKWASKIVDPFEIEDDSEDNITLDGHPKYAFDDDTFAYFAVGNDEYSTLVYGLLAVDYETGAVYNWTPDGFVLHEGLDIVDVDEPQIIPIDEMTADEFAHWIDSGTAEEFDIRDTDPEERNLYTQAESELDFEELARAYTIIAAGPTDGVYTPVERSQNAKVQARGQGGKFGKQPSKPVAAPTQAPAATPQNNPTDPAVPVEPEQQDAGQEPKVQKARLPVALPLVADPAKRIEEWVSTAAEAPVTAAGEPVPPAAAPTPDQQYTEQDQAVEDAATGPTDEALYFAEVDKVDKTAVLDVVAIVKQEGAPVAFIRKDGAWQADPDVLTQLQGITPPPVVELEDPETVKTVLGQIDAHDAGDKSDSTAEAPQPGEVAVAASGFALPDGSYTIFDVEDLQQAVLASGAPDLFVKAHIRKRARALNRMDIVPEDWREFSLAELGELSAASQSVYGEFGEIIVASGVPGTADTPRDLKGAAKLKNYWTRGKGALKIRWGTKGDLTRAHRHLSKYVGPEMAWGLVQNYHKELFGVYNYTHDVATGQYSPRGKK